MAAGNSVSIQDFERIQELLNRIDSLIGDVSIDFQTNSRSYESISKDINVDGISTIIKEFIDKVKTEEKNIVANLENLRVFLSSQATAYETLNQNAQDRAQATKAQIESVAESASDSLGSI